MAVVTTAFGFVNCIACLPSNAHCHTMTHSMCTINYCMAGKPGLFCGVDWVEETDWRTCVNCPKHWQQILEEEELFGFTENRKFCQGTLLYLRDVWKRNSHSGSRLEQVLEGGRHPKDSLPQLLPGGHLSRDSIY